MKNLFQSLAAGFVLLAAHVTAKGINYDPNHLHHKHFFSIGGDIMKLQTLGFNHIRTHWVQDGDVNMGQLITGMGLNAALGVPYPRHDTEIHVQAAIRAANEAAAGNGGRVVQIFVGNENLANAHAVPHDMIALIHRIKAAVGPGVQVGTVQRNTEFLDHNVNVHGLRELIDACDVVGVNIHPFFSPNVDARRGIQVFQDQWHRLHNDLQGRYPGLEYKLALTEVGWPTAGSINGNYGDAAGAKYFYDEFERVSGHIPACRKYYFQGFDQPQRPELYEKTFGILTADGNAKF